MAENAYVPLQDGRVASRGVLSMADSVSHLCLGLGGCTGTRKCIVCVSAWLCAPTAVVPVAALSFVFYSRSHQLGRVLWQARWGEERHAP